MATEEQQIRALEELLLTPAVRASRFELESLLSDQFVEFGSSGRVYSKAEMIEALIASPGCTATVSDFRVLALAANVMLATYRSEHALRSSLWRREGNDWRMIFHQGTPASSP
jgi:hypothetical protein